MKGRSSHSGTSSKTDEKVCRRRLPSFDNNGRAAQTMEEESSPPLNIDPTGNALRRRLRTASVKISRKASAYSSSELNRTSRTGSRAQ